MVYTDINKYAYVCICTYNVHIYVCVMNFFYLCRNPAFRQGTTSETSKPHPGHPYISYLHVYANTCIERKYMYFLSIHVFAYTCKYDI